MISEKAWDKLYNGKIKEKILRKNINNEGTLQNYITFLKKVAPREKALNKDICLFSKNEILKLFYSLDAEKPNSLRALLSICKSYSYFTYNTKINKELSNCFEAIDFKKDILLKIKDRFANRYITEEILWNIANNYSDNPQNTICLLLPFYGIKGNRFTEMINLKNENIDFQNNIININNKVINCPANLIQVLKKAIDQKIYETTNNGKEIRLVESDYVIRPTIVRKEENISYQLIAKRCKTLLEKSGFDVLSINDIYNSGKIHLLNKIETNRGEINISDYKVVQERFGENEENYANLKEFYEIYKNNLAKQINPNNINMKSINNTDKKINNDMIKKYFTLKIKLNASNSKIKYKLIQGKEKRMEETKNNTIKEDLNALLNILDKRELLEIIKISLGLSRLS